MFEENQDSIYEILKPIVTVMKYLGFAQQMPKQKLKYLFIQMIRILIVGTIIKCDVGQFTESIARKSCIALINSFFKTSLFNATLFILFFVNITDFYGQTIQLSRTSTRSLKTFSNIFLGVLILSMLINLVTDLMKLFLFNRLYFLTHLDETKIDRGQLARYFSFISGSALYFVFVYLPFEACCFYSTINCMIISRMFKELNKKIEQGKFKLNHSDIRKVQLTHHRISGMSTKLSRIMSIPLFLVYYRIVADICQFSFHIVSYIMESKNSGFYLAHSINFILIEA